MKLKMFIALSSVLIILALVYFFFKPVNKIDHITELSPYIWQVETDQIVHITITLPRRGRGESWFKKEDFHWYFDDQDETPVDIARWGGGIPLILSGPRSSRELITENAEGVEEQYGLLEPGMIIKLLLNTGEEINVLVGDKLLDGSAYYIKLIHAPRIFTIDESWVSVLENLVLDPPLQGITK